MRKTMSLALGPSYRTAEALVWPWMVALTRRDWRGQEHLGRHGEGIVVAVNHISWFDPLVIAHYLHDNGRPPRFMAKQSVFEVPAIGRLIRGAGQIPINRDADPSMALSEAVRAVRDGECLVMYPEGTITRDPGLWPMKGRTGSVRVALLAQSPLVPVAQWGANEVMGPYAKEFKLLPRKRMQVLAGPPVDLDDLRGQDLTREALEEGTRRLMAAITAQLEVLRGEQAPADRLDWVAEKRRRAAGEGRDTPDIGKEQ